jgi:hypothetical protein
MKTPVFLLLIFFPFIALSQVEIILQVSQPPELGFEVSKQDTTIVTGGSVKLGDGIVIFGGSGGYSYSWLPSASLDNPLLLKPVATPTDTTTYVLTVTDGNGCSFSVNYTVNVREVLVISEFIPDNRSMLNVILYPNPNTGLFKIQFKGLPTENINYGIVDNTGRYVFKKIISNFAGELTESLHLELTSGIYYLEVVSQGKLLKRQFIIH